MVGRVAAAHVRRNQPGRCRARWRSGWHYGVGGYAGRDARARYRLNHPACRSGDRVPALPLRRLVDGPGYLRSLSARHRALRRWRIRQYGHYLRLRCRHCHARDQDHALSHRGGLTMARMKFLCDADRCIECNACTTACKNEHNVPWGINRRRLVTIGDGAPGEKSVSIACMHCTDAPCIAVCPVSCIYQTDIGVVLHDKDLCIGCGYCFYACPFGAPQYPQASNFGSRGKMDKCTYCAGGPEANGSEAEYRKYGRNRIAEGKLPLCAEMCSTRALLAGDGEIISQIYRERTLKRGYGSGAWGWTTAYYSSERAT